MAEQVRDGDVEKRVRRRQMIGWGHQSAEQKHKYFDFNSFFMFFWKVLVINNMWSECKKNSLPLIWNSIQWSIKVGVDATNFSWKMVPPLPGRQAADPRLSSPLRAGWRSDGQVTSELGGQWRSGRPGCCLVDSPLLYPPPEDCFSPHSTICRGESLSVSRLQAPPTGGPRGRTESVLSPRSFLLYLQPKGGGGELQAARHGNPSNRWFTWKYIHPISAFNEGRMLKQTKKPNWQTVKCHLHNGRHCPQCFDEQRLGSKVAADRDEKCIWCKKRNSFLSYLLLHINNDLRTHNTFETYKDFFVNFFSDTDKKKLQ